MPTSKSNNKKIIGITLGDPTGIGPEVISKCLNAPFTRRLAHFVVIGHRNISTYYPGSWIDNCTFIDAGYAHETFTPGKPSRESGRASLSYLKKACTLLRAQKINALVTGPLSKELVSSNGIKFQGHTEFLADFFRTKNFGMMFVADQYKVVTATRHIPLKNVNTAITARSLFQTIALANRSLRELFKIKKPKLAICGLNPHAGEKGVIGTEEITSVIPAIQKATRQGINIQGPFSADTLFCPNRLSQFDCAIALYHDQGLAPLKALCFDNLVNVTIGLPVVRTSPAHGTAFNIAGCGKADASSMQAAIKLAVKLSG